MSVGALLELKNFQVLDRSSGSALTRPFHLEILPGSVHLIKGKNGIGKSSLIRVLTFENQKSSERYHGTYLKIAGLNFIVHPQISAPMFALPLRLSDILTWSNSPSSAAHAILGDINLDRSWDSCSGGERQRVLLASLFSLDTFSNQQAALLVLDEPMNHLDRASQRTVIQAIEEWRKSASNRAVLIVSHEDLPEIDCQVLTLQAAEFE